MARRTRVLFKDFVYESEFQKGALMGAASTLLGLLLGAWLWS